MRCIMRSNIHLGARSGHLFAALSIHHHIVHAAQLLQYARPLIVSGDMLLAGSSLCAVPVCLCLSFKTHSNSI